jgi:mannose-1-phosphate guanylyltransferase
MTNQVFREANRDRAEPSRGGHVFQKVRVSPSSKVDVHPRLWSIILAGGNGDRLSALVRQWTGRPIPKQYCAFVGTRSMLQHTLDRAVGLGRREHQLTVIAKSHQVYAQFQLADRPRDTVIVQPANRDTLPGVFLPLTYVYARDAQAMVVIYPSDHFIYPEKGFAEWIAGAVYAAEEHSDRISLIGVMADSLVLEYGWISPGALLWRKGEYSLHTVKHFSEKPSLADAAVLLASGCLWNTMIVVAKVQTLWELGWQHSPETMRLFERLKDAVGTSCEAGVLDSIYEVMPERNFSADLLTPAARQVGVIPMDGILWSDWGRAERIAETLCRIGRHPNFPMMLAGRDHWPARSLRQNNPVRSLQAMVEERRRPDMRYPMEVKDVRQPKW